MFDVDDWDEASRGVHPFGEYEVRHSAWIRRLERE
jgi:hypothetical protein